MTLSSSLVDEKAPLRLPQRADACACTRLYKIPQIIPNLNKGIHNLVRRLTMYPEKRFLLMVSGDVPHYLTGLRTTVRRPF